MEWNITVKSETNYWFRIFYINELEYLKTDASFHNDRRFYSLFSRYLYLLTSIRNNIKC